MTVKKLTKTHNKTRARNPSTRGAKTSTFVGTARGGMTNGEAARADALQEQRDDAVRLLTEIKKKRLDPRDLSKTQRQACLLLMACGKQTSGEMAVLFRVSPQLIRKDLGEIRRVIGREVREWDLETVLGQLAMAKEKCAAQAMAEEDPGLAWTIERDFVKLLKELGVVGVGDQQEGIRVTMEALGAGYERATRVLALGLDRRLTGKVENEPEDVPALPRALPLGRRLTGREDEEQGRDQAGSLAAEEAPGRPQGGGGALGLLRDS